MEGRGQKTYQDRRKKPDLLVKSVRWFIMGSWLTVVAAVVIIGIAKPKFKTFFDKWREVNLRTTWNTDLAKYFLYAMIIGFCTSVFGILIDLKRHRRKDDQHHYSLEFIGIVSIIGIIMYFIFLKQ